jgi:hypothetical protein
MRRPPRPSPAWPSRRSLVLTLALWFGACAPTLDWREVRPTGTSLVMLFPCKPTSQQRAVMLGAAAVPLTLYACQANELTWALGHADVVDAAQVEPALLALRAAAKAKMGEATTPWAGLFPAGATPQKQSGTAAFAMRGPAGEAMQMQLAVFAHGTRVFQATVLGARIPGEAAGNFFSSVRLNP